MPIRGGKTTATVVGGGGDAAREKDAREKDARLIDELAGWRRPRPTSVRRRPSGAAGAR